MNIRDYCESTPNIRPLIYAYTATDGNGKPINEGYIKVGYTARHNHEKDLDNIRERIYEQTHVTGLCPNILEYWPARDKDGNFFTDKDVHKVLEAHGHMQLKVVEGDDNEWYKCQISDVQNAIFEIYNHTTYDTNRTANFSMRPEQEAAVLKTWEYYEKEAESNPATSPKFLWNAKMRFGKTFATYELAKIIDAKRVLVLTFKPAVQSAWREDLNSHVDFDSWQFISEASSEKETINIQYEKANKNNPIVCFGSFQDFLGKDKDGRIKSKNMWVHEEQWDLVVFDEYHFGAWRDASKQLCGEKLNEEEKEATSKKEKDKNADTLDTIDDFNETFLPITAKRYLYLSGTPFRALSTGEFTEDQIFSWTYSDEQREKNEWEQTHPGETNPYIMMPKMILFTYEISDITANTAYKGEFDEFDLNIFFKAEGSGLFDTKGIESPAHFVNENDVQKWLDIIRGNFNDVGSSLKTGAGRIPLPYQDVELRSNLRHTFWYLPNVASCEAMYNLLHKSQNKFYCNEAENKYVICCAGDNVGCGIDALGPVNMRMNDPLNQSTITLSCGKLTTGVTVRPWTGIFMLRNIQSPESYFQAAFRVQSPWEIKSDSGEKQVIKPTCYVFDFAINRALRQVADYSCNLQTSAESQESKVQDFIKYLPVLAFDGTTMKEADASEIMEWTVSGTAASLLARKWQDAALVHVDNDTLKRVLHSEAALSAINKIQMFRQNAKEDLTIVITESKKIKSAKTTADGAEKNTKKELTAEEKEVRNRRKDIREKLEHFMARIPVFMYMTDCREESISDVISTYESELFELVTDLTPEDYHALVEAGVFDSVKMNNACAAFRRYEDSSIRYTGIDKHSKDKGIGLFNVSISREEYKTLFEADTVTPSSNTITISV